ncbi:MAG: hypothetical protein KDC95_12770 [Planctomycetes bacterium]|nr:hypothetical protein [Planctomycetota bacterium]
MNASVSRASPTSIAFVFTWVLMCMATAEVKSSAPLQDAEPVREVARTLLDVTYPPAFECSDLILRGIRTVETHPSSPANGDLVLRLLTLADRADTSPTVWPRIRALLDVDGLHGTAVHNLRTALSVRASLQNDDATARELSPRLEYALNALAIGPFGDRFDDGFGRPEAPEFSLPAVGAKLEGRFGTTVSWRPVEARPLGTRLELEPRGLGTKGRGTHFGLVQVESNETRPAFVQLTCSSSHEAWWNGTKIASLHRVADRGPTRQYHGIVLRKGWNHLLFKCTSPNASSFSARFVDDRDRAYATPALHFETKSEIHEIAPQPDVDLAAPTRFEDGVVWFENEQKNASGPFVLAAMADLRSRDGFGDEGLAMAKQAFAKEPDNLALRAALIASWRLARHVPTDISSSETRRLLQDLPAEARDSHAYLFFRHLDQLVADDKKEDAMRLCNARLDESPDELILLDKKYRLAKSLDWDGEARRYLEKLAQTASQPTGYLRLLADDVDGDGAPRRAFEIAKKALEQRPGDPAILRAAASLAQKTGQKDISLEYLKRRYDSEPDALAMRRALADLAFDDKRYDEAMKILVELRTETPEDPDLLERIANVAYRMGDDTAAISNAEACLALRPERHDLRQWITIVNGATRFPELEPWKLDVATAMSAFEMTDADRAAPTTLVLDQMVIRVYADGSQMEETHVLRHVNDATGVSVSESADAAAGADELLALRTITPDGLSWSPHRVAGSFTMPRLAPGVFLEEHYRNTKPSPDLQPIDFVHFFFRGTDKPYRFSRLVVVMPKSQNFGDFVFRNFPKEGVQIQDVGDLRAWIFLRENQTPIETEKSMPEVSEIAPSVTFGRNERIAPAIRLWKSQFEALTVPFREIEETATTLCKGKTSAVDKARTIHEFVHRLTPDSSQRSGSPQPVSVLLKREGPRFWLELALLTSAGISWKPAVIRPYAPGFDPDPAPLLLTDSRWPARGALVTPEGASPYWLILGAPRWTPFGALPTQFGGSPTDGCPYLLLEGDVGTPGILDGPGIDDLEEFRVRARVELREGNASWVADITMPSSTGLRLKERVRTMPEDSRNVFAQQLTGYFFRGPLTLGRVEWIALDDPDARFELRLHLLGRGALRKNGDIISLAPLIPPTGYTRLFGGRETRVHPFVIPVLQTDDWEVRIDPGQLRFVDVPDGSYRHAGTLDWSLAYELDGNELVVRRKSILRPGRIAPEDYASFLRTCREMDDAETRVLRLR